VVQISPTSTNPRVTAGKPYTFRACFLDPFQGYAMAAFAREDLGAKTAAVMYDKGNNYVLGLAEHFKLAFEERGGSVLVYEGYTEADADFAAIMTKVADAQPDVLFLPDYYNKVNLIGAQAQDAGITATLLGADSWDSADLDLDALEGAYFSNHYSAVEPRPLVQQFHAAYKEAYGLAPNALAVLAYDATNVLLEAIRQTGSTDPRAVRDTLAGIEFEGVSGVFTFDENGDPIKQAAINRVTPQGIVFVKWIAP
jgi:branched-chain amino acid transport system substrate-binding protein